ncbi:MAG TPA: FtsX-like permease family protein [Gemmatimonadaceae bacterium]|nr:FtsX-like permease family protein [Gemmatimonadaceae bacterium]
MNAGRVRALLALAWRESRTARRRLLLFTSSISIGVAALVAIDSYSSNVTRSIQEQSRSLLGADLTMASRNPFPAPMDSLLDSLRGAGAQTGGYVTFGSMAVIRGHEGTRLVQVRAATPGVPYYGEIETAPAGLWPRLHDDRNAVVDSSLLIALDAAVGDTVLLGYSTFRIIATIQNVPGEVGFASSLGPRVFIPQRFLEETKLVGFGSRALYETLIKLPGGANAADKWVEANRPRLQALRVRARTVSDTEEDLTEAVGQLNQFLGIVGLVALLLGGIGVASAIHAHISEKNDTVAVLRCLGATAGQVLAIYVIEAATLGFIGAAAGVVLGIVTQLALPYVIGGFLPLDVTISLVPSALLVGLGTGIWVATLFALLPLLGVRRISPLQTLRRELEPTRVKVWRDLPRILTLAALLASVVTLAIIRADTVINGIGMSAAIAVALFVLWVSAAFISRIARAVLRQHWPFVVRQGVANLYRPANQTRPVMLSLGFGVFLISTLYVVQANLLQRLTLSGEATRANLAFFDVQQDQVTGMDSVIRMAELPILQQVPIVPMRIASVKGTPIGSLPTGRGGWALRREYRSSYRDTLIASETLTEGKWFSRDDLARQQPPFPVSMEREVATELGVAVNDTVVWDIQGVRMPTVIRSLREVNWARFEPNFFVVFPPRALSEAPASYVFLTHAEEPAARARLQRDVVDRFPNVSSIDLSLIQDVVNRVLTKVSVAVRFMALFSVVTGALVLVSAVAATRRQRMRESVLLKTLGATRAQIGRIMFAEYALLGALGSLTGMILSVGGAWGVMRFVFELPFTPVVVPLIILAGATMLLTVAIGLLTGRAVFAQTPMAALREA